MAIRPFPIALKESLKKKNAYENVEKVPITHPDVNKVPKGYLKRQKFIHEISLCT